VERSACLGDGERGPGGAPRCSPPSLRASAAGLAAFPEVFGDPVRPVLAAAAPPDAAGFTEVRLTFEHEMAAVQRLAGFGGQIEILSPATVRARLVATARELLERYQPGDAAFHGPVTPP